jgi:hypothetical protein
MPSKSSKQYTFSSSSGALAEKTLNGGLYKYGINATFGSSAVCVLQIKFDSTWVNAYDITGAAVTDTSSGAVNKTYDVYLPAGCICRLNITTDAITSGDAFFSPVVSHNAA